VFIFSNLLSSFLSFFYKRKREKKKVTKKKREKENFNKLLFLKLDKTYKLSLIKISDYIK